MIDSLSEEKIEIAPINIKLNSNFHNSDIYLILKYNGNEFYS